MTRYVCAIGSRCSHGRPPPWWSPGQCRALQMLAEGNGQKQGDRPADGPRCFKAFSVLLARKCHRLRRIAQRHATRSRCKTHPWNRRLLSHAKLGVIAHATRESSHEPLPLAFRELHRVVRAIQGLELALDD